MDPSRQLIFGWTLLWLAVAFVVSNKGYDVRFPTEFSAEGVLTKNLMAGYEKETGSTRPVANHSHSVPVKLMLQLIQIVDLDEKNQVLKLNLWTNYYWIDECLRWNPDDYEGVTEIRIPSDLIWTPDIKLYNYADTRKDERRDALCVLSYDGSISWTPQGIYMSICEIDILTFPFDEQSCLLKFGSWTYDGTKLNLTNEGDDEMKSDDYFIPNKAWSLISAPAVRNVLTYACCPVPYIDITYTVTFRRTATFYMYILILPCVLLTTLTLVLFWIPPESSTKMALGMSIFMAFFVLLLLFEKKMPPASANVPILGTYYCLNMILITTSTFLNVFVVNLSFYGSKAPVPKLLKKVMFVYFARALRMDYRVRPFIEADKNVTSLRQFQASVWRMVETINPRRIGKDQQSSY